MHPVVVRPACATALMGPIPTGLTSRLSSKNSLDGGCVGSLSFRVASESLHPVQFTIIRVIEGIEYFDGPRNERSRYVLALGPVG